MERVFIPEKRFMAEALRMAKISGLRGEVPVGAVVELDGEIIGVGYNTREGEQNPFGHAEMMAISDACRKLKTWRLDGASLYVTLEPCPMCAGAAINARISRIIFGAEDNVMGACGTAVNVVNLKNASKCEIFRNFMEDECRALIRVFFDDLRSKT